VAENAEIISGELAGMTVQIREGKGTISQLLYSDKLSKSLEGTASNAELITGSMAGIAAQIKTGEGSIGSLVYTDSLAKGLKTAVNTANTAMVTIEQAAYGFSENMKALQGNIFLRGYFKKKAKADNANAAEVVTDPALENAVVEMDEAELKEIIAEAQKALDAKKAKQ
jgi:phospholipid/cholesterol/gamma-HCH transport system substrate-binding protein